MKTFGIQLSQSSGVLNPVNIQRQAPQGETDPSISNKQSRLAQTSIMTSTPNAKTLQERNITANNVLSKEGLKVALGKASRYGNIKDKMMRTAFKMTHRSKNPDKDFGSLHKSVLRLAEHHEKLVSEGASASVRLGSLKCLETTLQAMQEKHVGKNVLKGKDLNQAAKGPVQDMLQLVRHEIACQPQTHRAKAYQLMHEFEGLVQQGKEHNVSDRMQKKLDLLVKVEDHLLTAREGGVSNSKDMQLLELVQNEMSRLKTHVPLEKELSKVFASLQKNNGDQPGTEFILRRDKEGHLQKLKHVHTRQVDHLAEMREQANGEHTKMKERHETLDFYAPLVHTLTNALVETFDPSKLNPVTKLMRESDGLEVARGEFVKASHLDSWAGTDVEMPEKLPLLTDHGMPDIEIDPGLSQKFADVILQGADSQAVIEDLGNALAKALRELDPTQQMSYATSDGKLLKSELLSMLAENCPELMSEGVPDPLSKSFSFSYENASSESQQLLDKVFLKAVSQLSNRQVDDDTVIIGGETFTKKNELGKGSSGIVYLYEGTSGKQIAIKHPSHNPSSDVVKTREIACREVRSHYQAMGEGHPHIVNMTGVIRNSEGDVLVAMDLAPRGDVFEATKKIDTALQNGQITQKTATIVRLTLLQDMIKGLQHMHESRGMTHLDIKPLNYFINEEGLAMLGDFGTSDNHASFRVPEIAVDNPRWLAPEIAINQVNTDGIRTGVSRKLKNQRNEKIEADWKKMLIDFNERGVSRREIEIEWQKLNDRYDKDIEKITGAINFEVSNKADVWSLGITAYEMFVKEGPFKKPEDQFLFQVEQRLRDFGSNPENRLRSKGEGTEGFTALDRLLNQLLKPDPKERISLSDALNSSVFKEGGVGTTEARKLIQALTDKNADPETIQECSKNLGD
ncbi:protein kinase domain-containing protein [Prosthecobacter dejongeii]|uniref:Serine/threonine protein kinase n=1 Tax=Prosthecobacter dejongeii TaxID=48465 RepID=A0A7W8DPV0_9BACT|nr:protein kinase [Prosthecobacter dejongeii]MBB5037697.1 serine/threonine protein kinase [Prosthecobacter dejongeii]